MKGLTGQEVLLYTKNEKSTTTFRPHRANRYILMSDGHNAAYGRLHCYLERR